MFTPIYPPLSDVKDELARRRVILVRFEDVDTGRTVDQSFSFGVGTDIETIKKIVMQFADELNFVPPPLDDLTPTPEPTPEPPTKAELDRNEWIEDWKNLQAAIKLQAHGVSVLTAPQLDALKGRVQSKWLNSYRDVV